MAKLMCGPLKISTRY